MHQGLAFFQERIPEELAQLFKGKYTSEKEIMEAAPVAHEPNTTKRYNTSAATEADKTQNTSMLLLARSPFMSSRP